MKVLRRAGRVFSSPVGRLGSLTLLGQLLLALSLPITARLYGPFAVGVFATVLTLGQAGAIVASGRVEQVLPRLVPSRRPVVARAIAVAGPSLSLVLGPLIAWQGRAPNVAAVVAATLLVASLALYALANMSMLADRDFKGVSRLRIINAVATGALQILGGVVAPSSAMLIASYAGGNLLAAAFSLRRGVERNQAAAEPLRKVVREERLLGFAASVGASALLTSLTLGLPVIGIAYIFGEEMAASYFLVRRLLALPTQLAASTINEVSYSLLANLGPREIRRYVDKWLKRLVVVSGALLVVAVIAAQPASIVLGGEYDSVAIVMVLQAPAASAQLLGTSLSNVLLVLSAEHIRLIVSLARFIALLAVLAVIMSAGLGFIGAVALLSAVTVVGLLVLLFATLAVVSRADAQ